MSEKSCVNFFTVEPLRRGIQNAKRVKLHQKFWKWCQLDPRNLFRKQKIFVIYVTVRRIGNSSNVLVKLVPLPSSSFCDVTLLRKIQDDVNDDANTPTNSNEEETKYVSEVCSLFRASIWFLFYEDHYYYILYRYFIYVHVNPSFFSLF